jgi:hypothetical protein
MTTPWAQALVSTNVAALLHDSNATHHRIPLMR